MGIESSLERIATALETLIGMGTPAPSQPPPQPDTPPATKSRKKMTAEPKPEPKPEVIEEVAEAPSTSGGFDDDEPAVVEDVPSKEDMIAALTELGTVIGTDKARELMAKFGDGAKKASEVPDSKRADVIKQAKEAKAKAAKK